MLINQNDKYSDRPYQIQMRVQNSAQYFLTRNSSGNEIAKRDFLHTLASPLAE